MKCPRTKVDLKPINAGKIKIFVSEACGGVFFKNQDVKLFTNPVEKRGQALIKYLKQFSSPHLNESDRVRCPSCPSCPNTVMLRRYFDPLKLVEIDECPSCGGVWLDHCELNTLQDNHLTERERAMLRHDMLQTFERGRVEPPNTPYGPQREESNLSHAVGLAISLVN